MYVATQIIILYAYNRIYSVHCYTGLYCCPLCLHAMPNYVSLQCLHVPGLLCILHGSATSTYVACGGATWAAFYTNQLVLCMLPYSLTYKQYCLLTYE